MVKIAGPSTPYEDLQQAVKKELREFMIDAAEKMGCHPEQLRARVVRNTLTGATGWEIERIPDGEEEKGQQQTEHCPLNPIFGRKIQG